MWIILRVSALIIQDEMVTARQAAEGLAVIKDYV